MQKINIPAWTLRSVTHLEIPSLHKLDILRSIAANTKNEENTVLYCSTYSCSVKLTMDIMVFNLRMFVDNTDVCFHSIFVL